MGVGAELGAVMPVLSYQEMQHLLERPLAARLGCIDDDGFPYVVPIRYQYENGTFFITARLKAAWATFLRNDPRLSMCIDTSDLNEGTTEGDDYFKRVVVKGTAHLLQDEPHILSYPPVDGIAERALRRQVRYMDGDVEKATQSLKGYAERKEGFWQYRIASLKITTWRGDYHPRYRS
jgi:Pyridoxamine 5'-phosphate oxidase